jgi:hypothetical protein
VLTVIRIRDRLDIVGKTVNTANIFRGTSTRSFDTARVLGSRLGVRRVFKDKLMPPAVSEVVFVAHPQVGAMLGNEIADSNAAVVKRTKVIEVARQGSGISVPGVSDLKLVQMRIRPTHRGLDQLVQFLQRDVLRLDPSPDHWISVLQADLETIDGSLVVACLEEAGWPRRPSGVWVDKRKRLVADRQW